MSKTILIPEWGGFYDDVLEDIFHYMADNKSYREFPLEPIPPTRSLGFVFEGRLYEVPPALRDSPGLPWSAVIIAHNNSPLTTAINGAFVGADGITANVECYANKYGTILQAIRVKGPRLDDVNKFYDNLVAGKLNHLCTNPVAIAEQPLSLQVLEIFERIRSITRIAHEDGRAWSREDYLRDLETIHQLVHTSTAAGVDLEKISEDIERLRTWAVENEKEQVLVWATQIGRELGVLTNG